MEGSANSSIAVTGHGSQEENLSSSQGQVEEHLGPTACRGNGVISSDLAHKHLGHSHAYVGEIHESELADEEVHGGVEAGL